MCRLHELGILHGDLKCPNLLMEDVSRPAEARLVITDFGLARSVPTGGGDTQSHDDTSDAPPAAWTLNITPPEILEDPVHAPRLPPADVYAFGMVLLEILTGAPAWPRGLQPHQLARLVLNEERPRIPSDLPSRLQSLIAACWAQQPQARPTFPAIFGQLEAVWHALGGSALTTVPINVSVPPMHSSSISGTTDMINTATSTSHGG
jgi:serine/threonine protein kinase